MIEPDYDLKKIKGDSRRASAVLAPEREIFSAKSEEDEAPSAQERLPAHPNPNPKPDPDPNPNADPNPKPSSIRRADEHARP